MKNHRLDNIWVFNKTHGYFGYLEKDTNQMPNFDLYIFNPPLKYIHLVLAYVRKYTSIYFIDGPESIFRTNVTKDMLETKKWVKLDLQAVLGTSVKSIFGVVYVKIDDLLPRLLCKFEHLNEVKLHICGSSRPQPIIASILYLVTIEMVMKRAYKLNIPKIMFRYFKEYDVPAVASFLRKNVLTSIPASPVHEKALLQFQKAWRSKHRVNRNSFRQVKAPGIRKKHKVQNNSGECIHVYRNEK